MIGCYIIGEPGVGKTTLMNGLLAPYKRSSVWRLTRLLCVEPLTLSAGGAPVGFHLGKTRELFGGTDALSMSVHPEAVEWARTQAEGSIFGEGQRLATYAFLTALAERGPVLVIHINGPTFAEVHRAERGTGQNEQWVRGAQTRVRNLLDALQQSPVHTVQVEAGPYALLDAQRHWEVFSEAG